MKKLTKWLALAVALLMVALMMVACDTPKEPEKTPSEGLFYRLNADGESYSVEGIGECTDTDIVIPSTYEGKPVTSIDDYAFDRCNSLTSITIPDSVTRIGDSAFIAYSSLISITVDSENPVYHSAGNCLIETETKTLIMGCNNSMIPTDGSVTSIGSSAFFGCDALTSITIPDSVTRIGNWAFLGCSALTSVTIPDSVTYIGDRAFESCSSLEDIVIPDGVTRIGYNAFAGCTNLAANLVIPHSVAHIGWGAFDGCGSLASITVDSENPVYHSAENCLIETERKTLIKGCNNSVIPTDGSVTSIGDSAFELCNSLTSITIPDSVTSIGDSAFFGCSSLTNITIPDSVTRIGGDAFAYCTNFSSVTIPKGVTHIGDSAFRDCSGLASITVDNENPVYHSIGNCLIETESKTLIARCKNSVIPDDGSVTRIGNGVFSGCSSFTSIVIPECVTSIGDGSFAYCTALTSITIPDSVTRIGYFAFSGCSSLDIVYYGGTASEWSEIAILIAVGEDKNDILEATIYYYSETEPTADGNYWRYVDGVPTAW